MASACRVKDPLTCGFGMWMKQVPRQTAVNASDGSAIGAPSTSLVKAAYRRFCDLYVINRKLVKGRIRRGSVQHLRREGFFLLVGAGPDVAIGKAWFKKFHQRISYCGVLDIVAVTRCGLNWR